ncbi:MAG: hypothetical protein ACRC62_21780 [Microcoleus sp.]
MIHNVPPAPVGRFKEFQELVEGVGGAWKSSNHTPTLSPVACCLLPDRT